MFREITNSAELDTKLENATTSTNIGFHFKNSDIRRPALPTCFIIEGIEAASADIINHLSRWANRSGKRVIRRPIICSCNNIYAQNLKDLRNVALAIKVSLCNEKRLTERIQAVLHNC
jgi:hypothetical protein